MWLDSIEDALALQATPTSKAVPTRKQETKEAAKHNEKRRVLQTAAAKARPEAKAALAIKTTKAQKAKPKAASAKASKAQKAKPKAAPATATKAQKRAAARTRCPRGKDKVLPDGSRAPKFIDTQSGRLHFTFATAQSYVHLDGLYLCNIFDKMSPNHQVLMARMGQILRTMPQINKELALKVRADVMEIDGIEELN